MKQDILTISFFVLIALYVSGFLFAGRQILNSRQSATAKALEILGLFFLLALFCLVTFLIVAFSTNPWAH